MTTSAARVLALLEIFQAGGVRSASVLADRLDVDERTVRRSITQLIDLGIPVDAVRGRYGGYRLAPGYRMPPLMLTDDEALAVMLGLVTMRRSAVVGSSATATESAAAKLRRVLPVVVRRQVEALLETADFTSPARADPGPGTDVLLALGEATSRHHPASINYTDRSGRTSERTLLPYGLVVHSGRWYVTGSDSSSGEIRTFRVDRITAITLQPGSFDAPAPFDAGADVVDRLERAPRAHEVCIRIRGSAEHIRRHLPAGIAGLETGFDADTEWVRVRLGAERLDWVPPVLAAIDRPFVIERPPELRDLVRQLADRLRVHADAD